MDAQDHAAAATAAVGRPAREVVAKHSDLESRAPKAVRTPRHRMMHALIVLVAILALYFLAAYVVAPAFWKRAEGRHPALDSAPRVAHTKSGIPGDSLNLSLIGSEEELVRGMHGAGWYAADPITLKSSLRIIGDTVLHRSYDDAPVSSLYVWGHKQDLAFEQPIGDDPRRRHHVRFWKSPEVDEAGRPLWLGAATMDVRVGLSHTTGQVTHHISPEVDAERNRVIADLQQAGALSRLEWIDGFQTRLEGRNGGGDPYHTDGRLAVGVL